jgi:hypothetical protein
MKIDVIQNKIYSIRGQKVMIDFDLAELYEIETRALKQAVKRNITRFPDDFMFQLNNEEINNLVSQSVIPSKSKLGGAFPYAFTEQGVAMLSSILNSEKAILVNISIIRAFVMIRHYAISHKYVKEHLLKLENKYDKQFIDVYEVLDYLLKKDEVETIQKKRNKIGF